MRVLLCLLLLFAAGAANAQSTGRRFVSVAFHDVVDTREELTTDAVTSDKLVRFFDWLKGTGWTVVSLDDVLAAQQGKRPLPDKAILLTFDDGYRSLYTRVFPLLKIYRYPAVAAVVGTWMEGGPDSIVRYGEFDVPRSKFITWAEAREMQASGLVEFASHSYDLHWGARANPQGNAVPAARTWRYDPATERYENDPAHRARIRADLDRSRRQIATGLGRAPRALVWPFGRFSGPALEEAKKAGFSFAFTLEAEPADAGGPLALHRYFPNLNPALGEIADNLRFDVEAPETVRVACIALDSLAALNGPAQDAALGTMIENLRTLGANKVVIDGQAARPSPGAALGDVFFPSRLRPMKADLLSRAAWQLRSRANVEVYLHLPLQAAVAAVGEAGVPVLYADMLRHAAADGIVVEAPGQPPSAASTHKNAVRKRRAALDPATLDPASRQALNVYRAATAIDPLLRLMLASPVRVGPADWADYVLLPPVADANALAAAASELRAQGWLRPEFAGHVILGMPTAAGAQVDGLRRAQHQGATGFALCPAMPALPPSAALAAAFSAATFPYRP
ncbi:MAG: poly-beta-1,6-N-acetyl-D-glucosamine N-deacetylase PgaB [Reyranella sp.]|nr:poly-beta-1,6-N-acetyl-D-glucosamine N-deacetylase PgaB [Reyranella sp.]